MTAPSQDDSSNIGNFYKFVGLLVLVLLVVMFVLQRAAHHETNKWDAVTYGIVVLLDLALLRPRFVDSMAKWLADKLPFINYTKP